MENTEKPPRAGMGRPRGSPNKATAVLREAILKAAENAGNGDLTDYLTEQARKNPRSFLTLLAKVLPSQIDGKLAYDFLSHEEALAELDGDTGHALTEQTT